MNRLLTYTDLGAIWVAILVAVLLVQGCVQHRPIIRYAIQPYTLVKAEPADVLNAWLAIDPSRRVRGCAKGFYDGMTREMWVPYGYGDAFDADILLHEMRHLPEIEGVWHE